MDHHRDTETQRSEKENLLTEQVIGACIEVHRQLGPGLLESVYEECVCDELAERRIWFERQQLIPIRYKGKTLSMNYRLDLVIEQHVIVKIKSVERLLPIHSAQILTYLKLTPYRLGLLVNFNEPALKHGIRRFRL